MSGQDNVCRIGIDLGGTKIAAVALLGDHQFTEEHRLPTPRHDYEATLNAIKKISTDLTNQICTTVTQPSVRIGIAIPGSVSPATGRIQNANSTWLNAKPFEQDLARTLGLPLRIENDANCFALSEALDGAGQSCKTLFGVILGTGCGGALIANGELLTGRQRITGEWGHNPLPWPDPSEYPGSTCWCGKAGCIETWLSGPALARDHSHTTGKYLSPEEIVAAAANGEPDAIATRLRHLSRLARSLAHVVNIFDPDAIVIGGGLSNLPDLYDELPSRIAPYLFCERANLDIRKPRWGDASGVRGAARLWSLDETVQ